MRWSSEIHVYILLFYLHLKTNVLFVVGFYKFAHFSDFADKMVVHLLFDCLSIYLLYTPYLSCISALRQ